MSDRRVKHGPRLRDKKYPSSYALCGCGRAKRKTSGRCAHCSHAFMKGDRRGYDACACGGEKLKRSGHCGACQFRRQHADDFCTPEEGDTRYSLREANHDPA